MTFSVEGLVLFVMQFNIFPLIIPKYHGFFYNLWSVKKIIDLILNKHSFHTYQPDLLTQSEFFFFFHGNPTFLLFQLTCRPL